MISVKLRQPLPAEAIRPRAWGPLLLPNWPRRKWGPLAGAIGLHVETCAQLRTRWQDSNAQLCLAPGLGIEAFACSLNNQPLLHPQDWLPLLHPDQLAQVSGAYALAWQENESCLHLIRDPMGERTLFYAPLKEGLIFASRLELLLQSGLLARRLNLDVLSRYLSYAYIPGRETLLQGIFELQPGEWLRWEAGQIKRFNFWQPPGIDPELEAEAARKALRNTIELAVESRLPSTGAIGASLSGGIDSSLVVALLARLRPGQVHTWSVSFGAGYRNELAFSQVVASACKTHHQILEIRPATVLHFLDETLALLGNPIGDPLTVPNALLFRTARQVSPVLFNGEGGDPLFGGPKNIPMLLADLYQPATADPLRVRVQTYLYSYRKLYTDLSELLSTEAQAYLTPGLLEEDLLPWLETPPGESLVQRLMLLNTRFKGAHHILYKVNALSEALGVLPASPLFDRRVTELAFRMAPELKLRGHEEKYILKQAVADLLPEVILKRPKSGMQVPVELWFRPGGPLHRSARQRLERLGRYPWFERAWLNALMRWELPGYLPRHGLKVWILLSLEAWLRHYLGPP